MMRGGKGKMAKKTGRELQQKRQDNQDMVGKKVKGKKNKEANDSQPRKSGTG